MRHLGNLPDETQARTFVDYVLVRGVKAKAEQDSDGWAVWVFDEDSVPTAREEFAKFLENPAAPIYSEVARQAAAVRADERTRNEAARKRVIDVRQRWRRPMAAQIPLTFVIAAACVFISFLNDFGKKVEPLVSTLAFARMEGDAEGAWLRERGKSAFSEIRQGQVWRLVTPIFLHLSVMHLIGNVYWTILLGGMIESRRGAWTLLFLVLACAVVSNTLQAWFVGPGFGGISGVTHGLFGYVWMQSRYSPESGISLNPSTVVIFMLWFLYCLTGWAGPIANTAHWSGLVMGLLAGYAPKALRDLSR